MESSATWIGIDGFSASSLIQTGTTQQTSGGVTQYFAWLELLPGAELPITNAPVNPGDAMEAAINETSLGVWTIAIEDLSANWVYSGSFNYSSPGLSAEWIEEAPTVGGNQSTLADFGTTTFGNMQITVTGSGSSTLVPLFMVNPSDTAIIGFPGAFDSASNSFTDYYGTPVPVITSISPSQGSTGGGTAVTIAGFFLVGVVSVAFGTTGSNFANENGSTTVTTAPSHSAGTVDVTVTTPGGRSSFTSGDEFTYSSPPSPTPTPTPAPTPPMIPHGYWLVGGDGGIFTFGSAQFYGSTGNLHLQRPVVGITPTTSHSGYWLVGSDGGTFAFGSAGFYGSIPGLGIAPSGTSGDVRKLGAPIVAIVPSIDGRGYFMVGSDGGVFAFGDAQFAGSCPSIGGCAGPAVAVMPDASGNGYWLVTATGNIYTFGDAGYFGAPGATGAGVTSAVRTPDGGGYWILLSNGAVYAYGDARDFGTPPPGATGGLNPATAIFSTADGQGYWIATADGTIFPYGDAPNDGSMAGQHLNAPIIAAVGW